MENILPIILMIAVAGVMCFLLVGFVRDIIKFVRNKKSNKEDKDNGTS